MDKETLIQMYNSLNQVEVKGFENINRLFGVMLLIQNTINSMSQEQETNQEQ